MFQEQLLYYDASFIIATSTFLTQLLGFSVWPSLQIYAQDLFILFAFICLAAGSSRIFSGFDCGAFCSTV